MCNTQGNCTRKTQTNYVRQSRPNKSNFEHPRIFLKKHVKIIKKTKKEKRAQRGTTDRDGPKIVFYHKMSNGDCPRSIACALSKAVDEQSVRRKSQAHMNDMRLERSATDNSRQGMLLNLDLSHANRDTRGNSYEMQSDAFCPDLTTDAQVPSNMFGKGAENE